MRLAAPLRAAILLAMLLRAAPAFAQIESREGIALQNQILELRQDLNQLQQLQVQANGAGQASALPPPQPTEPNEAAPVQAGAGDVTAQLLVRVASLEEQVRSLQGRVEELTNQQQRQADALGKQIGDLAFKLGQGGAAPGSPQEAPPPGPDTLSPPPMDLGTRAPPPAAVAAPPRRRPELALQQGNAALARRDYAGAEAAAREVLAGGHGPRTGDAQFLLSRALSGEHQYKEAAASFFEIYRSAPKSPRGAEALLGVSAALTAMNDSRDACQALAKLGAEFPAAGASVRREAAGLRKRAACR